MPIVSVITDPGIGGTFLTWSLAWLSGIQNYFCCRTNKFEILPDNPLTDINAHHFQPNQPNTLQQLKNFYNLLGNMPNQHTDFVYFHNLMNEDHSYPPDPALDQQAAEIALAKSKKCIVLRLPKAYFLYKVAKHNRTLGNKFNSGKRNKNFQEQNEDFLNFFYGADMSYWRDVLQANEVWDQREFLALNLRPFDQTTFDQNHLRGGEYFLLHAADCYFALHHTMLDIFDYLEDIIDQQRWNHWLMVYQQWQLLHIDRIKFAWYFNDIIHAIIQGYRFDLGRFNLDLYQEAVIQHVLLYQHNLNLKTYRVEKFYNTVQLHDLLEPNVHHILNKSTRLCAG